MIEDRKLWKGWRKKGCRLLTKCCLFSFALQCKLKILKSFAVFSFHFHETSLLSSFAQLSLQSPAVETTHHLGAGLLVKSNGVEGVTSNGAGDSNKPRILTTHQVHVNYSQRNSPVRFSQGARKRRSVLVWIWNTAKKCDLTAKTVQIKCIYEQKHWVKYQFEILSHKCVQCNVCVCWVGKCATDQTSVSKCLQCLCWMGVKCVTDQTSVGSGSESMSRQELSWTQIWLEDQGSRPL